MTYRIKDWASHYENNRSKEIKKLEWVPVPNRMDGDGYTELIDHPDGAAHLGAWLAMVQVASRCEPRGTLMRDGGRPHDSASLSRISRIPATVFDASIPRFVEIGWIEELSARDFLAAQKGAAIPQEGAGLPQVPANDKTDSPQVPAEDDIHQSQEGAPSRAREKEGKKEGTEEKEGTEKPICAPEVALQLKRPLDSWFDEQHDRFYDGAYWKKVDRSASKKAFKKQVCRMVDKDHRGYRESAEFLISAAIADKARSEHTEDWNWRQNLHPATWLNGSRWTDQASSSPKKQMGFVDQVTAEIERKLANGENPW